jgi:hypothetical protein
MNLDDLVGELIKNDLDARATGVLEEPTGLTDDLPNFI